MAERCPLGLKRYYISGVSGSLDAIPDVCLRQCIEFGQDDSDINSSDYVDSDNDEDEPFAYDASTLKRTTVTGAERLLEQVLIIEAPRGIQTIEDDISFECMHN